MKKALKLIKNGACKSKHLNTPLQYIIWGGSVFTNNFCQFPHLVRSHLKVSSWRWGSYHLRLQMTFWNHHHHQTINGAATIYLFLTENLIKLIFTFSVRSPHNFYGYPLMSSLLYLLFTLCEIEKSCSNSWKSFVQAQY